MNVKTMIGAAAATAMTIALVAAPAVAGGDHKDKDCKESTTKCDPKPDPYPSPEPSPSDSPSPEPSESPSPTPSEEPSEEPTLNPTPSEEPTRTPDPSPSMPTVVPDPTTPPVDTGVEVEVEVEDNNPNQATGGGIITWTDTDYGCSSVVITTWQQLNDEDPVLIDRERRKFPHNVCASGEATKRDRNGDGVAEVYYNETGM